MNKKARTIGFLESALIRTKSDAIRTVIRDLRLGRVDAAGARAIAEAILRDGR